MTPAINFIERQLDANSADCYHTELLLARLFHIKERSEGLKYK